MNEFVEHKRKNVRTNIHFNSLHPQLTLRSQGSVDHRQHSKSNIDLYLTGNNLPWCRDGTGDLVGKCWCPVPEQNASATEWQCGSPLPVVSWCAGWDERHDQQASIPSKETVVLETGFVTFFFLLSLQTYWYTRGIREAIHIKKRQPTFFSMWL